MLYLSTWCWNRYLNWIDVVPLASQLDLVLKLYHDFPILQTDNAGDSLGWAAMSIVAWRAEVFNCIVNSIDNNLIIYSLSFLRSFPLACVLGQIQIRSVPRGISTFFPTGAGLVVLLWWFWVVQLHHLVLFFQCLRLCLCDLYKMEKRPPQEEQRVF